MSGAVRPNVLRVIPAWVLLAAVALPGVASAAGLAPVAGPLHAGTLHEGLARAQLQPAAAAEAYRLGLAYRNGAGQPKDAAAAVRWLTRAAEGGVPEAMFTLSNMLADGEGAAPDPAAARRWLEAAAQLEYPEALQALAMSESDPRRAAELMREAGHALGHRAKGH